MTVKVSLNYLRIAPRKVRLVADLIRKRRVNEAQSILAFTRKKAAKPILSLLKSALANAKHNFQLEPSALYISKITVNEGPKLKRWRPRARGQAYEIQKKTSHITLVLEEIKKTKKEEKPLEKKTPDSKALKIEKEKEIKPEILKKKKNFKEKIKTPEIPKGIKKIFRRKAF